MKRGLISIALLLIGTAAYPFSDGFEAKAQTCISGTRLDIGDGKGQILLAGGGVCQVSGESLVKAQCQLDPTGNCKRTNTPPEPPIDFPPANCQYADPMTGFTGYNLSWSSAFFGKAYPASPGHLSPVGSFSVNNRSMSKKYIAIPFKPTPNQAITLRFYGAQSIPDAGYRAPRPAKGGVFFSVSECAGDLRPYSPFSGDPALAKCRVFVTEGTFSWTTVKPWKNVGCPLDANKQYYLNIAFTNTATGYNATTTCRPVDQNKCEINISSSGQ